MTAPIEPGTGLDAATSAELNDLLRLDHDAIEAYGLAIRSLANVGRRETVMRFRADHERHVADLQRVIRRHGGTPVDASHGTAGAFKLAMQKLGALGGDREVMLAFKANEGIACERYTRAATHAGAWPDDVRAVVSTAADDEARHYEWAEDQLETLGVGADTLVGRAARVAESVHGGVAAGAERVERGTRAVRERLTERLPALPDMALPAPTGRALAVGAIAAGVGFLVTAGLARLLRDRD